ncbi:L,D-transpeptidase [Ktedonobacter racemifer]|nr:L,D-transpeptidase [Ktedonobacter racemifer]
MPAPVPPSHVARQTTSARRQARTKRLAQMILLTLLLSALLPLVSACGADPRVQQEKDQSLTKLTQLLKHAQDIGVPSTTLHPILTQKQNLDNSSAPWNPFNAQLVDTYYTNAAHSYDQLYLQLQGVIDTTTERTDNQAQDNLQKLQITLAQQRAKGYPTETLQQVYTQNLAKMKSAQYPKDYLVVSDATGNAIQTLNMMPATSDKLATLKSTIDLMTEGKVDVTTLKNQYESDQKEMAKATKPDDLKKIDKTIDVQYQQAAATFKQDIPIIAKAKVDDLETKVNQLKSSGVDVSNYEKRLAAARDLQQKTKTLDDYKAFSKQIDDDLNAMQKDLIMAQARQLLQQFHNEVKNWGNAHMVSGAYYLNVGYMDQGIGSDLDAELANASTMADYQTALNDIQNAIFHHQMLEADYNDKTPYNQVHQSDLQLLDHYKLKKGTAVVISMVEETLRFYRDGQLINSFYITAGRQELPALPGLWSVLSRETNIKFKSPYPKGSPYWYEDTPINYAIGYHAGGYFLHDSYWRADYGPGTQFPHVDATGNSSASNGSHGCINMPTAQAAWLMDNSDWNTSIILY